MRSIVAQTHLSTQSAPSPQDARLPRAHEDQGGPQGPGGAPQEGPPSPHAHLKLPRARAGDFPARRALGTPRRIRGGLSQRRRRSSAQFVIFYRANGGPQSRFGISVKKALGGAVVRNRIRRRIREILRRNSSEIPSGWDLVIHPRRSVAQAPFAPLEAELLGLLRAIARGTQRGRMRPPEMV